MQDLTIKLNFKRTGTGKLLERLKIIKPRFVELEFIAGGMKINASDFRLLEATTIEMKGDIHLTSISSDFHRNEYQNNPPHPLFNCESPNGCKAPNCYCKVK